MKFIVYHSPCGGVGKTTLSVAKALKSSKSGKKVLLLDMATFGSINFFMRDSNLKSGLNRVNTLFTDDPKDISVDELSEQLMSFGIKPYKEIKGLHTLYAANPIRMDKLDYEHVNKLIEVIKELDFDEVIVDTSSDLHVRNIAFLESADEINLIATPDLQCSWQLCTLIDMLNDLYISKEKMNGILNKYKPYSNFNIKESEEYVGIKFKNTIPYRGMKWAEISNRILKKEHVIRGKHYKEIHHWMGEKI